MPKFLILSDIHSESHPSITSSLIESIPKTGYDAVILAGDVGNSLTTLPFLKLFCSSVEVPVFFVAGNHEHYHSSIESFRVLMSQHEIENLIYLDCGIHEFGGLKIAGAPLWFSETATSVFYRSALGDFKWIQNFRENVYSENEKHRNFLVEAQADIIVTHHLPTWDVINPRYRTNPYNCFFVGGDPQLVETANAKLWVFGHTHCAIDTMLGTTRAVANPRGYYGENSTGFNPHTIIEL
jgi:predicted phosphodiesterase